MQHFGKLPKRTVPGGGRDAVCELMLCTVKGGYSTASPRLYIFTSSPIQRGLVLFKNSLIYSKNRLKHPAEQNSKFGFGITMIKHHGGGWGALKKKYWLLSPYSTSLLK